MNLSEFLMYLLLFFCNFTNLTLVQQCLIADLKLSCIVYQKFKIVCVSIYTIHDVLVYRVPKSVMECLVRVPV